MRKSTKTQEKLGLNINFDKTKYLNIGKHRNDMDVNENEVMRAKNFCV